MALKDRIQFGTVLPHRSQNPLDMAVIKNVAQRAEALGFRDLWVTENTLDHAFSLDPFVVLTYAAAATTTIRLGTAVVVFPMHSPIHVAHQAVSLDCVSNGRAILGIGLGRTNDYHDFQVALEHRVRRFTEGVELMKALWTQPRVTYEGRIFRLADAGIALKSVQKPHPPLWFGGAHPDAVKRAARLADGWMGGGAQPFEDFSRTVPILREALASAGRDPGTFSISKRIFIAVDKNAKVAEAKVRRWFTEVYRKPELTDLSGIHGAPEQVREKLERLADAGANHLVLNSVSDYPQQVEALADAVALR